MHPATEVLSEDKEGMMEKMKWAEVGVWSTPLKEQDHCS